MVKKRVDKTGYVKTQTMVVAVCIAFALGMLGGIVLTVYKSSTMEFSRAKSHQHNESERMIPALEAEAAGSPENVATWTRLGNLYFDNGKYKKAVQAYEKSIALDPNNSNVLTDLGIMYRRTGQPAKAVEAFDKAMRVNPKHEAARFNKGIVLMHDLNDREGALRVWEELVDLNPLAMAPDGQSVDEVIKHYREHGNK